MVVEVACEMIPPAPVPSPLPKTLTFLTVAFVQFQNSAR